MGNFVAVEFRGADIIIDYGHCHIDTICRCGIRLFGSPIIRCYLIIRKIYLGKYFFGSYYLRAVSCTAILLQIGNQLRLLYFVDLVHHHAPTVAHSTSCTCHARGLACRGFDIVDSIHSGDNPPRFHYINCVLFIDCACDIDYFWTDIAQLDRLLPTRHHATSSTTSVAQPDSAATPSHPIKKLSVPLSRINYYLLSPHPNTRILGCCTITLLEQIHSTLGAVPLLRYRKYIQLLGEFLFFSLAELSSPAQ
jgi:hypothetical protein